MNLILIGYRGSGKTSVGKILASRLNWPFVDVDDAACNEFGIDSIAEIWKQHGEPKWREVEVQVTRELCSRDQHVIGLGGGTLMQPGARAAVESADALRVYLKAQPEELYRRISGDTRSADTRPNLTNLGGGVDEITQMLEKRGPVYEAVADEVMDVSAISVEQAADRVLAIVDHDKHVG